MKERPDDSARLQHIRDAIFEIESFTSALNLDSFKSDSKTIYATIKLLEIIGGACYHITENLKKENSQVPWQQITALRHILVHEYYGIQHEILWRIITSDLPLFKENILKLITSYKNSSP